MKKFNYYNLVVVLLLGACVLSCKNLTGLVDPVLKPVNQSVELDADVTHYQHKTLGNGWWPHPVVLSDDDFKTEYEGELIPEYSSSGTLLGYNPSHTVYAKWITVENVIGAIDVKLEKNTTNKSRTAKIDLFQGNTTCYLTVTQKAAQ